ncbi:unnamed protein product [Staurois parvus]|uniref:Uncharacterized protein n=1 Tax=Staurois parvus TaxID=386267 RepID=A0ABN9EXQ6_9NEOB|nr:unnamed protein product [Staurois parvus]
MTLGMSVTQSQFSPVSECPPQSCYKSLILPILVQKKIPVSIPPFVNAITFM